MMRYDWFGFWRPDQEVAIIVENLASVRKSGPLEYDVTLTPAGVEALANPPPPKAVRLLAIPWRIQGAKVGVTMDVQDGALTGFTLAIDGVWVLGSQRERISCRKTRDLKDVGQTTFDLPDGIAALLDG